MVRSDSVADVGTLLVLLGELHSQECVREFRILVGYLSDIVEKAGPLRDLRVEPEFGSHGGTDVRNLTGVLQKVLSVGRTVLHAADELHELDAHAVDSEVDQRPLSGLKYLVVKLFRNLCNDFLYACRVDSAVDYKLVQSQTCNLPADRVERGKEDGVGSVVDHDLDACRSLESPDVAALTSDDPSLDLVVLDRERRDRILDRGLGCCPLYCGDYYSLGFLRSVETSLVHRVVDVGLGLGPCLGLHVLHQHVLGFLGTHPGDVLELLVCLLAEAFILSLFLLDRLLLRGEACLCIVCLAHLALEIPVHLVQAVLLLLELDLDVLEFAVPLGDIAVVLALELQELLLCLEDLVLLYALGLVFRLGDDLLLPALQHGLADEYVDGQCQGRAYNDTNQQ